MFKCSAVFHANYISTADVVINQGGTDSTKTYSILQVLCVIASTTKAPEVDPIISVVAESVPNVKLGAYRIFESLMQTEEIYNAVLTWNKSYRTVTFKTGWVMEFLGADTEQKARQGKRQYLFVNEANGIPWQVFWQYAKRTRIRTFIDYNPSAPFWPHEKLIGTTKEGNDLNAVVQLIISDHRHNPFIDAAQHEKTENIKDEELWKVYARGLTGNLSGLIYTTWKQIDDVAFPWSEERKFLGIDFGYTNDPTAIALMVRVGESIYCHEICYTTGLTARQIFALLKPLKIDSEVPIYCEHDGDMIRQLRSEPYSLLAIPARKGAGSIKAGISKVQEYQVFYTASSKNIAAERSKYMWMKDDATGKFVNVPTDVDNHLMDAIRYGVYTHFYHNRNEG